MNISVGNSVEPSVPPMLGRNGSLADRMQTSSMLPTNASSELSKQADLSKISSIIGDSNSSSGFDDLKKLGSSGLLPSLPAKTTPEKGMKLVSTENPSGPSPATSSSKAGEKVAVTKKRRPRKKWKKPKDKPNRPLSAYNLFFQQERVLMLGDGKSPREESVEAEEDSETVDDKNNPAKRRIHRKTHGKVGFAEMARSIGAKWKALPDSDKDVFVKQASKEKERYAKELAVWKEQQKLKERQQQEMMQSMAASNSHSDPNQSNGFDAFADSAAKQRLALLQDATRGSNDLSTINLLRALQGQQQQHQQHQLGSESNINNNNMKSYPNAAEASANAIFQQFQGFLSQQQPQPCQLNSFLMPSTGGGNDMQPSSSLSLAEQLQLNTVAQQRMQLERLQMQQLLLQNQLAMSNVAAQAPVSNNPSLDMLQQQMNQQMNQQFQPNNVGNGNQLNFLPNQQRP